VQLFDVTNGVAKYAKPSNVVTHLSRGENIYDGYIDNVYMMNYMSLKITTVVYKCRLWILQFRIKSGVTKNLTITAASETTINFVCC